MKLKGLLLLVMLGAVLVSASVGTLSEFHTSSAFSAVITVDTQKIKDINNKDGLNVQAAVESELPAAEETQAAEPVMISE